jgi:hypothetical protein
VREELAVLARQGDDFRRILEPKKGDPIYPIAVFLDAFDIRTAYPLLLTLLDAKIDDALWADMSGILEYYLLRRGVGAMNTKNYNRVFLSLTKTLRRDGITAENLARQLATQSGESVEWPSDAEFKDAWILKPAYELGNAKLVHIFARLNGTYLSSKSEPLSFDEQPSIEHILPQKWIEHWPMPDGSKGMDILELLQAQDDDPRAAATLTRGAAVPTMGNLTILTQALNSAQSNSAWSDKRPELMKHSLLSINQDLRDVDVWDEAAIRARSEALFERAVKLWPRYVAS